MFDWIDRLRFKNVIVDGSYLAYSQFCAGQMTAGFMTKIREIRQWFDPKSIYVAWDNKNSRNLRKKINESYKSNRKKKPDEYYQELMELKYQLRGNLYQLNPIEGEGDDVIYSFCHHYSTPIGIWTVDKDLYQVLCCKGVSIIRETKNERVIIDKESFISREGITPDRYQSVLAIAGDSCDGIRGVPGFGMAGTMRLFKICPNLIEAVLVRDTDSIETSFTDKRLRNKALKLIDHIDLIKESMKLVRLYMVNYEVIH